MPRKTADPLARPRAPLGLAPVLWLAWGLAALAVLFGAAALIAERTTVPASRSYGGTLHPDGNPVTVALPAGLPLDAVLVRPGQEVRAGQTLAVYDKTRIATELARLERDIIALAARRDCLLTQTPATPGDPPAPRPAAAPPAQPDPEMALRIRAAVEACQTDQAARALDSQRLTRLRDRLAERHALIGRQITLTLARAKPRDKPEAARKTLALALEQNRIKQQIDTIEIEDRTRAIDHDRARLQQVQATTQQIEDARRIQAELAAALAAPRLTAPEDGIIARVRPVPLRQPMTRDADFIDIQDPNAQAYAATITLSGAQAASLEIGTPVTITLIGYPDPKPRLNAEIQSFEAATTLSGTTRVTAKLKINKKDQEKLAQNKTTIALKSKQTAANIKVQKNKNKITKHIKNTWENVWAYRAQTANQPLPWGRFETVERSYVAGGG